MFEQKDQLKITQIIHDPWGSYFGAGKQGAIGGHGTHLHLGFAKGPPGDSGKVEEDESGNTKVVPTGGAEGLAGLGDDAAFSSTMSQAMGSGGGDSNTEGEKKGGIFDFMSKATTGIAGLLGFTKLDIPGLLGLTGKNNLNNVIQGMLNPSSANASTQAPTIPKYDPNRDEEGSTNPYKTARS